MAGFGSNLKRALDSSRSLKERAVNLRSCAMNLSHIAGVPRSEIIDRLRKETEVDLHSVQSEVDVLTASEWLRDFRSKID